MKGFYVLALRTTSRITLELKSIERVTLEPGGYAYVGSAMGNGSTSLENRIGRHFREEKKIHWHIDHLLREADGSLSAVWATSETHYECQLASALEKHPSFIGVAKGFGASDCRGGCYSHLFEYVGQDSMIEELKTVFRDLRFVPHVTEDGQL